MAITIQKIAELAGVSRGTVDRVLNKRGRVDAKVSESVLEIAKQHGYQQKPRKKGKLHRVGVITQLSEASFMQEIDKGIKRACQELEDKEIEFVVLESKGMNERIQLSLIDELLEKRIDALAIMPVDSERIRHKLNEVIDKQNIPVITFNSDIIGTKRTCYIGMDNRKSGQVGAGLIGLLTRGKGRVLIITGYFTNRANNLRVEGFIEELHKTYSDLTLLGVQSSQDSTKMVDSIVTQSICDYPDLAAIFIVSAGQEGIHTALKKANMAQRPYIVAYDITADNTVRLKRNDFDFLIDQESERQGYEALMIAYKLLKEKSKLSENIYTTIQLKTPYTI